MIYLEYEAYKQRFRESQRIFNDLLLEKERLFTQALPGAIRYDKDKVQTSIESTALETYVIALDEKEIDSKLDELRQMLADRELSVRLKEIELRRSNDLYDKVYVSKFLDRYSVNYTAKRVNYSRAHTYRIFTEIKKNISKIKNETK